MSEPLDLDALAEQLWLARNGVNVPVACDAGDALIAEVRRLWEESERHDALVDEVGETARAVQHGLHNEIKRLSADNESLRVERENLQDLLSTARRTEGELLSRVAELRAVADAGRAGLEKCQSYWHDPFAAETCTSPARWLGGRPCCDEHVDHEGHRRCARRPHPQAPLVDALAKLDDAKEGGQ